MGHTSAGHRRHPKHLLGTVGQCLDPTLEQVTDGCRQLLGARAHGLQQLFGEEWVALGAGVYSIHQVRRRRGPQDAGELGRRLAPPEAGQLDPIDVSAPVQLGQVRAEPGPLGLVTAVGQHQQHPFAAQIVGQEGQQVASGLLGPVQVLDDQQQESLVAESPEQAE